MNSKAKTFASLFASLAVIGFMFSACSSDDVKDKVAGNLDPVPGATANLVVTSAPSAMLGVITTILPNSAGLSGASLTSAVSDKNCGTSGSVDFTTLTETAFTAEILDCADEDVVVDGSASGTFGAMDPTCDLPTSMNGTFTGTVNMDGDILTFTDFGVNATNIAYGPDCDLDGVGAAITAILTGQISMTQSGETISFDFGTSSVVLDVTSIIDENGVKGDGVGRQVTFTMNGDMTVATPCQSGSLLIATSVPLQTSQPSVCPIAGQITVTGDFGSDTVVFDGSCDLAFCAL